MIEAIIAYGWRQGAVLGEGLRAEVLKIISARVPIEENDWLIVVSHDCDVCNHDLAKEPTVEILKASVIAKPDKTQTYGRNPRSLQFVVERGDEDGGDVILACNVHDRWFIPRNLLSKEPPLQLLPDRDRRLIAEWIAKRYIRSAFPTAFDARWRSSLKKWIKLLERYSEYIQGIYLRLHTLTELGPAECYRCHLIVAAPSTSNEKRGWVDKQAEIETDIEKFWEQFTPGIVCDGVEILMTSGLTLADIEPYQRFDADWVSFFDESDSIPAHIDMQA